MGLGLVKWIGGSIPLNEPHQPHPTITSASTTVVRPLSTPPSTPTPLSPTAPLALATEVPHPLPLPHPHSHAPLPHSSLGLGNTAPVAEFNIQSDPEAARVVMHSGARVAMVPLDVTHTALATDGVLARLTGAREEARGVGVGGWGMRSGMWDTG